MIEEDHSMQRQRQDLYMLIDTRETESLGERESNRQGGITPTRKTCNQPFLPASSLRREGRGSVSASVPCLYSSLRSPGRIEW